VSDLAQHLSDRLSDVYPDVDNGSGSISLDRDTAAAILARLTTLGGLEADVRIAYDPESPRDAQRSAEQRLRTQPGDSPRTVLDELTRLRVIERAAHGLRDAVARVGLTPSAKGTPGDVIAAETALDAALRGEGGA